MPVSDWFKKREERIPSKLAKRAIPDGIWSKCAACGEIIFQKELFLNWHVCPQCNFHFKISAFERIALLVDVNTFSETESGLQSQDPLNFEAKKSYFESLRQAKKETGLKEAVVTGTGRINSHPVCLGVMDFRFIGGSMGSVVGEKITRLVELAYEKYLPLLIVTASGGARMQEGMLSLMQMAKTTAAISRYSQTNLPFIVILTNPTTGGVSASFATLADVIIAEPNALIGFAGPRVIEQTLKQKLPKGFQSSEFMLTRGLVDTVVSRGELKDTIAKLLDFFGGKTVEKVGYG